MDEGEGLLARAGHAATAFGVVVLMTLLLAASPVVALYGIVADAAMDARDQVVRPRPFRGAPHGLPFLDAPAPAAGPTEAPHSE